MFDKLAIALISPLGTALALGLFAILLAGWQRTRMASSLGALALAWLGLWSLPLASHTLRGAMEASYPPISVDALQKSEAIVVLGGGIIPAERTGQSPDLTSAADRVWHGARLFHANKAPLLVLSGGSNPQVGATSEAEAMRQFAADLGVPANVMLLEQRSRNTRQNAKFSYDLLKPRGVSQILLVTSALHMGRAVALFEAQGFTVTAAATDHESRSRFTAVDLLPDSVALDGSARAFKEIVGRIMGR